MSNFYFLGQASELKYERTQTGVKVFFGRWSGKGKTDGHAIKNLLDEMADIIDAYKRP